MILSAEALEVLTFLKSTPGQFVALNAIARQAGGRKRYDETPGWARGLMGPLVESGLVEVNERGHYRVPGDKLQSTAPKRNAHPVAKSQNRIVGDDYFPVPDGTGLVGDNYFPKRG
jgi:hypothetical protein